MNVLLQTLDDLSSLYPTSKWSKIDALTPMLHAEEYNTLSPILGDALLERLHADMDNLLSQHNEQSLKGLESHELNAEEVKLFTLLRACQSVTLYGVLAHHRAELSTSLNMGGGFNRMSAGDYDVADKDSLKDLDRELFANLHRSTDILLRILERDAALAEKPEDEEVYGVKYSLWGKMWRESKWFYLKSDLLFTRAEELDTFVSINQSREKYIQMVPDLRYIQGAYIIPQVGKKLFKSLVGSLTDNECISKQAMLAKTIMNPDEKHTITEEELEECASDMEDAIYHLRMAAAQFLRSRTEKSTEKKYEGELAMNQAMQFIAESKWLSPKAPVKEEQQQKDCKRKKHTYNPDCPSNAIFVFGGGLHDY